MKVVNHLHLEVSLHDDSADEFEYEEVPIEEFDEVSDDVEDLERIMKNIGSHKTCK